MKRTHVEIKKGKDLPASVCRRLTEIWRREWPDANTLDPRKREVFAKDIFFLVRDSNNRLLSVGRLIPITFEFLGKEYKILGIGDIASVKKRSGYGKILMTAMHKYLKRTKQTGVGFCDPKNDGFYTKCGYKITKIFLKRFYKRLPKGKVKRSKWGHAHTLYLDGKDRLMKKILSHPRTRIYTSKLHW
ncbi:GNAT family N-acetyltransferase [Candidatus Woesearchaeota archaeon]|nr:GNAT family N-acetyltransferase [Candidatus Woesearchaeota archaeon]